VFLTARQQNVLEFVRDFIHDKGISPTLEEMSQFFNVSKVTIHGHVNALVSKGALTKAPNQTRSLELVEDEPAPPPSAAGLVIQGRIAAGDFIEAIQDNEEFKLDDMSPRMDDCFMLRVQGESMINDHICPGDLVIVEPTDTAQNADIVVAMVPDDLTGNRKATLKRFFREDDHIRLQPSNDLLEPILVPDCEIQGRVIGVVRTSV